MTSNAHLADEDLLGPMTHAREEHLRGCASCSRRREVQLRVRTAVRGLEASATPTKTPQPKGPEADAGWQGSSQAPLRLRYS